MNTISNYIAGVLGEVGVLQEEDVSSCAYGLEVFLSSVLEILSIIILSIFVGNLTEISIYFIAFIPLRIYAGGYHADTRFRCYIILLVTYVIFCTLIMCISAKSYFYSILFIQAITFIIVICFSPIIGSNKKRSISEIKNYKKISIMIVLIEMAIVAFNLVFLKNDYQMFCFSLGQLAVTLSMIAAMIKKSFQSPNVKN